MSNNLFNEFEPISTKAWKQKIQVDLKGLDYNDTLIWHSNDGINVKPFYNEDDIKDIELNTSPEENWRVGQLIYVNDVTKSNKKALDIISKGVSTIQFTIPNENINLNNLIAGIDLNSIQIQIITEFYSSSYINKNKPLFSHENVIYHNDCIGQLTKDGNWYDSFKNDIEQFIEIAISTNSLTVNSDLYQNAGANITQQIAYSLSHLNEYLNSINNTTSVANHFKERNLNINVNISVGSNYFFEIAKLRAIRILTEQLVKEYGFKNNICLNAIPSIRNKTLYDYNTNMLRTTTECMSAILGGANTIFNLPYDYIYHKSNSFGERISRNQLLILKHESYFDQVSNPGDGSYYIESLTQQLTEKGLDLFKDIEKKEGFLKQLHEGVIQKKIKESAQKEQEQFDTNEITLIGTNKFINSVDKMKQELELYPFIKQNPRKTLIEPIISKRLAEQIEQKRLNQEN